MSQQKLHKFFLINVVAAVLGVCNVLRECCGFRAKPGQIRPLSYVLNGATQASAARRIDGDEAIGKARTQSDRIARADLSAVRHSRFPWGANAFVPASSGQPLEAAR